MQRFPIKVAWLAPFPIGTLEKVVFSRRGAFHSTGTWLKILAEELAKRNEIELNIICEAGNIEASQSFTEGNLRYHLIKNTVPFLRRGYPHYFPVNEIFNYLPNSIRIEKILDKIKPDIVHAHGTENSYAIAAIRSNYPSVISIQGVLQEIIKYEPKPKIRDRHKINLEYRAIRKGQNFICRTNLDTSFVRNLNPSSEIYNVYEAINPVFFEKNWTVQDTRSILFVGSLRERKGIMVLLNSVLYLKQEFEDIHLYVIGTGNSDYLKKLVDFCEKNRLRNDVTFLGYQLPEVISDYHLKAQVLVCPSFIENSPNCVAEAMVTGLPVIASNIGGIPSMIINGETGYLVEAANSQILADRIKYLLSSSTERIRISNNAKSVARVKHLPQNVADNTISVYRSILDQT
ncbi:MAG TPA: glycosyltransferase family 4 protein [Bacteroidales bacterium]|nr:glycosyltransferase family 4 protein [Bacteroidales bacterium]HQK67031.1 glycosyltransferase family 4 protein [Bacteroidales bacterium]